MGQDTHRRWQRTVANLLAEIIDEIGEREDDTAIAPLAKAFCNLDDDQQAKFFVEVVRIAGDWGTSNAAEHQALAIGRHLKTCSCSTEGARDFIRSIEYGIGREEDAAGGH
ncbi:hypothetical protein LCGC14_0723260 [marine sediment metagenome]|uniref:Uncharacterized protein n=1 Tax=marine sediment metagenome TaxID=412755 RepID=A0A0F9QBU2_9ZZZZ